jgi:hypothetical protein
MWGEEAECYASSLNLSLGEQAVFSDFIKMKHPVTGQFGLFAFVPLKDIKPGTHKLTVVKAVGEDKQKKWQIPFYYSPS